MGEGPSEGLKPIPAYPMTDLVVLCLLFPVVCMETYFGVTHLLAKWRSRRAGKRAHWSLQSLAMACVGMGAWTYFTFIIYWLLQRLWLRGYNREKHAPLCRSLFLFFQSQATFDSLVLLFWYKRLEITFDESVLRLSKWTKIALQTLVAGIFVVGTSYNLCLLAFGTALAPVIVLDANPFSAIDSNNKYADCELPAAKQGIRTLFGLLRTLIFFSLSISVVVLFVKKIKALSTPGESEHFKQVRHDLAVKSAVLGIVSIVSSVVLFGVAVFSLQTTAITIDNAVNAGCIICFFSFSNDWYERLCVCRKLAPKYDPESSSSSQPTLKGMRSLSIVSKPASRTESLGGSKVETETETKDAGASFEVASVGSSADASEAGLAKQLQLSSARTTSVSSPLDESSYGGMESGVESE